MNMLDCSSEEGEGLNTSIDMSGDVFSADGPASNQIIVPSPAKHNKRVFADADLAMMLPNDSVNVCDITDIDSDESFSCCFPCADEKCNLHQRANIMKLKRDKHKLLTVLRNAQLKQADERESHEDEMFLMTERYVAMHSRLPEQFDDSFIQGSASHSEQVQISLQGSASGDNLVNSGDVASMAAVTTISCDHDAEIDKLKKQLSATEDTHRAESELYEQQLAKLSKRLANFEEENNTLKLNQQMSSSLVEQVQQFHVDALPQLEQLQDLVKRPDSTFSSLQEQMSSMQTTIRSQMATIVELNAQITSSELVDASSLTSRCVETSGTETDTIVISGIVAVQRVDAATSTIITLDLASIDCATASTQTRQSADDVMSSTPVDSPTADGVSPSCVSSPDEQNLLIVQLRQQVADACAERETIMELNLKQLDDIGELQARITELGGNTSSHEEFDGLSSFSDVDSSVVAKRKFAVVDSEEMAAVSEKRQQLQEDGTYELQQQLALHQSTICDLHSEIEQNKKELKELVAARDAEVERVKGELIKAKSTIDEQEDHHQLAILELNCKLSEATSKNTDLQSISEERANKIDVLKVNALTNETQLETLEAKILKLKTEVKDKDIKLEAFLSTANENEKLCLEICELEKKLMEAQAKQDELQMASQDEKDNTKLQLSEMQAANNELEQQLVQGQSTICDLHSETEQNKDALNELVAARDAEVERVKVELIKAKSTIAEQEGHHQLAILELNCKLSEATSKSTDLESISEERANKIDVLKVNALTNETQLETLEAKILEFKTEVKDKDIKLEAFLSTANENEKLCLEICELEKKLMVAQAKQDELQMASQDEKDNTKLQLSEMQAANNELEQQLVQSRSTICDLHSEIEKNKEELKELAAARDAEVERVKVELIEAKSTIAEQEDHHQLAILELNCKLSEATSKITDLESISEERTNKIDVLKANVLTNETQLETLEAKILEFKTEVKDKDIKLEAFLSTANENESYSEKLCLEICELEKKLMEARAKQDELQMASQDEKDNTKLQLSEMQAENNELEQQLVQSQSTICELRSEIEQGKVELEKVLLVQDSVMFELSEAKSTIIAQESNHQGAIIELQNKLTEVELKNSDFQLISEENANEIESLKVNALTNESLWKDLESEVLQLKTQSQNKDINLEALRTTATENKLCSENLRSEICQLAKELVESQSKEEELRLASQVKESKNKLQLSKMQTEHDEIQLQLAQNQSTISDLQSEIEDKKLELEEQSAAQALALEIINSELCGAKSTIAAHENNCQVEIMKFEDMLTDVTSKNTNLESLSREQANSIDTMKENALANATQLKTLESKLQEITTEARNKDVELASLHTTVSEHESHLEKLLSEICQLQSKLAEAALKNSELENCAAEQRNEVARINSIAVELQSRLLELQLNLHITERTANEKGLQMVDLASKLEEVEGALKKEKHCSAALRNDLDSCRAELQRYKERSLKLEADCELQAKPSEIIKERDALMEKVSLLIKQKCTLQDEIMQMKLSGPGVSTTLTETTRQLTETSDQLEKLKRITTAGKQRYDMLLARYRLLDDELQYAKRKLASLGVDMCGQAWRCRLPGEASPTPSKHRTSAKKRVMSPALSKRVMSSAALKKRGMSPTALCMSPARFRMMTRRQHATAELSEQPPANKRTCLHSIVQCDSQTPTVVLDSTASNSEPSENVTPVSFTHEQDSSSLSSSSKGHRTSPCGNPSTLTACADLTNQLSNEMRTSTSSSKGLRASPCVSPAENSSVSSLGNGVEISTRSRTWQTKLISSKLDASSVCPRRSARLAQNSNHGNDDAKHQPSDCKIQ